MGDQNIIYLHIGTPKTGTSAIQAFLGDNIELLEEKGYYYRTLPYSYERNVRKERNAHFIFEKVHDESGEIDYEESERRKQIGYQMIAEGLKKTHRVILTDETFWNGMRGKRWKKMEELMHFAAGQNAIVKIIVYLRCQEDFMYSWWKQNVKTGKTTMEWQEFIYHTPKTPVLNYAQHLKVFASYVGRENMIVRRYGKEYFEEKNIFSDFLGAIGINSLDGFELRENRVNQSIDDNCAELKRILNKMLDDEEEDSANISSYFERIAVSTTQLKEGEHRYSPYTKEELEDLRKRFEKSNEAIRKVYFPDEIRLFSTPSMQHEKWTKTGAQMDEEMILFFGQALWKQKKENEDLILQINELKTSLRYNEAQWKKEEKRVVLSKGEIKALKILLFPIKWLWNLFR